MPSVVTTAWAAAGDVDGNVYEACYLGEDGTLDSEESIAALEEAAETLDLDAVRTHLEELYDSLEIEGG